MIFTRVIHGPFHSPPSCADGVVTLEEEGDGVASGLELLRVVLSAVSPNKWGLHAGAVKQLQVIVFAIAV